MNSSINPKKYVVLDVETNGLSSLKNDLLSISIYKPDDAKVLNRFLPLELEDCVMTTHINGITEEMLQDKLPLTQEEFDFIIKEFELEERVILHYGNIDEKFIKNYLKRKRITGIEKLTFYNFKHDIISNKFPKTNISKDNLCKMYGIDNVKEMHSGLNDCILEWKLFNKMDGKKLFIRGTQVYELNKEYIIPVSYLQSYPNLKYYINNLPKVYYKLEQIKKFKIDCLKIKKFGSNIDGIYIEGIIRSLLNAENKDKDIENILFQIDNLNKLKRIGELPSSIENNEIPVVINNDGTIKSLRKEDKKFEKEINSVIKAIKIKIKPLIQYIKHDIFDDKKIISQELIFNEKDNILAKCDLSTNDKILEIKSYDADINKIKYQLYYEANGRQIYILQTIWKRKKIEFVICKVIPYKKMNDKELLEKRILEFQKELNSKSLEVVFYLNKKCIIEIKCKICGKHWYTNYQEIMNRPFCEYCYKKFIDI